MKQNKKTDDAYDYLSQSASTTECTGLMPTPAETKDERDSYADIFHYGKKPSCSNNE